MSTMKEAVVHRDLSVLVVDAPIPTPGPGEILIKIAVSGTNPKDWKMCDRFGTWVNPGDGMAGTVEELGEGVYGFYKGQRVAAYHRGLTTHGSFAEYGIAPQQTTFPLPESVSFEEGATVPLAAYTSAVALFYDLGFPAPWEKSVKLLKTAANGAPPPRPLIVYGASTAIGAFGIKLAQYAGVHPIIAIGSKNSSFITPFLDESKGDRLIDYTAKTDDELVDAIKNAIKESGVDGGRVFDAYDCVSEENTIKILAKVLAGEPAPDGRKPRVSVVLEVVDKNTESSVEFVLTLAGVVHSIITHGEYGDCEENKLFGLVWGQAFARGLAEGWFTGHPYEVFEGGLAGLESGLRGLKAGTIRAKKFLVRPGETEGAKA